jgi:hypothetical protein
MSLLVVLSGSRMTRQPVHGWALQSLARLYRGSSARLAERAMDISVIVAVGSCAPAVGLVTRGLFNYLDRQGDRQLARHVFEQTRSTDGLNGYTKLRRPSGCH